MKYPSYEIKSLPLFANQFESGCNYRQIFNIILDSKFRVKIVLFFISLIFNHFIPENFILSFSNGKRRKPITKRANNSLVPTARFLLQKW